MSMTRILRSSLIAVFAASLGACVADGQIGGGNDEQPGVTHSDGAHKMPLRKVNDGEAFAAGSAHLTYYGGPVIPNVKIVSVFWNSSVQFQSQLNGFYSAVT